MPAGTRVSTPIPRSYVTDWRLNSIKDDLAREAFWRLKVQCDNLGRMYGDPATLAGILYPTSTPNPARMEKVIRAWVKAGLVFSYKIGRARYIEVSDTGLTQRLVGNMAAKSEFPPPPQKMIATWERRTGLKWHKIQKKEALDSKGSTNGVQTGTNEYEHVTPGKVGQGDGSGRDRLEGEGRGSRGREADLSVADATGAADASLSQEDRLMTFDLMSRMTNKQFDLVLGFNSYRHRDQFLRVILEVGANRPLGTRKERIEAMRRVTNVCNDADFKAPSGWIKILAEMREEALT